MAFNRQKESDFLILLLTTTLVVVPVISTTNIDCNGKAFHCVNSTHFKICVDFGGVSKTVDEFLIPCPPSTVCTDNNYFECEYQTPTTSAPLSTRSDVTNEFTEENVSSTWELFEVTTFSPVNSSEKKIEILEDSPIYTSDIVSVLDAETSTTVNDTPVSDFLHKRITDSVNILNNTTIRDISESENLQTIDLMFNNTTTVTTTATTILTDNLRTSIAAENTEKYSSTKSEMSEDLFNTVTTTPSNAVRDAEFISTKLFTTVITDTLSINSSPASVITKNRSDNDRNLTLGSFKPVITSPMNNTGNEDLISTLFFPVRPENLSTNSTTMSLGSYEPVITPPTNNTGNEDLISTTIFSPMPTVNNLSTYNSPAVVIPQNYSDTDSEVRFDSFKAVTTTPMNNTGNEDVISSTLFSPVTINNNLSTNSSPATVISQNNSNTDSEVSFGSNKPDITTPMSNKGNEDLISTTISSVINDNLSIDSSPGAVITRNYSETGSNTSFGSLKSVINTPMNNTRNEDMISTTIFSPMTTVNNLSIKSSPATVITQNNSDTDSEMMFGSYKAVTTTPMNTTGNEDLISTTLFFPMRTDNLSTNNLPVAVNTQNYSNTDSELSFVSYKPVITTPMNNKGNANLISTTLPTHVITNNFIIDNSSGAVITRNYADTGSNVSFGSYKPVINPTTNNIGNEDFISTTIFSPLRIDNNYSLPAAVITQNNSNTDSEVSFGSYTPDSTTTMSNKGKEDLISTTISSIINDNLSIDRHRNYSDNGINVSFGSLKSVINTFMNNTVNEDLISKTSSSAVRTNNLSTTTLLAADITHNYSDATSEVTFSSYKPAINSPSDNTGNEDLISTTLLFPMRIDNNLSTNSSPATVLIQNNSDTDSKVSFGSYEPVITTPMSNKENEDLISTTLSSVITVNFSIDSTPGVTTRNYSDTGSNVSFGSFKPVITSHMNKTSDEDLTLTTPSTPVRTKNVSTTSSLAAEITQNYSGTESKVSFGSYKPVITAPMNNNTGNEDLNATTLFLSVRNSSKVAPATEIYSSEISTALYKPYTSASTSNIEYENFPSTTLIAVVKADDLNPINSLTETATSYTTTESNTIMDLFDPVITASLKNIKNVESNGFISSTLSSPMLKGNPANNEIIINGSSSDNFILAITSDSKIASTQEDTTLNPPSANITIANDLYTNIVNRSKDSSMHENGTYLNNNTKIITNTSNSGFINAGNNVTRSLYDILNLYRTTDKLNTIPWHVPTTTPKDLYFTIPTSNNRENIESGLEFKSSTMSFPVIKSNLISEVIEQKSPSIVNLTSTTQSKNSENKQKDTKVMEINPPIKNIIYTNELYTNVKNTSNDKDFEVHGDGTSVSPNIGITAISNRYAHELHSTTDANIYFTNTVEGLSTEEVIFSQMMSDNHPIPENNKLLETSILKSSDINFTRNNSYANVKFSTNMRNTIFPTASTITVNKLNTKVTKQNFEDTVQELFIIENDSYISTINDNITSINSNFISSTNAYTDELNFPTSITLNSTAEELQIHEEKNLPTLVRNESSAINENNEPSSHTTDSPITINSYVENIQRNMETSSTNNLTIQTSTDNVLKTFYSSQTKVSYNGTEYFSRELYGNDKNIDNVSRTHSYIKYDAAIYPSINVSLPIVTTVTPNYEQNTKTQITYDSTASKEITVSRNESARIKSDSYEHKSFDSTKIISDYPINISDTHKGNIEYNANFTNVNLSTTLGKFQLKTLDDTNYQDFSILRAKDTVKNEITPTEFQTQTNTDSDYISTTHSLRDKMDNNLTKGNILPTNENESISTTTINFNFSPLYNLGLPRNYNYKNNLSEPSILTSNSLEKPQIINTPSAANMFSTLVPDINSNLYSEAQKINNTVTNKDIGSIIGKDELSVTTENFLSRPSINNVHSIVKDENNIMPSKEVNKLLHADPNLSINPIFLNTDRTTPLNPALVYNKNIYITTRTLKPITSYLREDYFLRNSNNTPLRNEDKKTIELSTTLPNVTNGDLQITKINTNKNSTLTSDIGASISKSNLRKVVTPIMKLEATATTIKNISSDILLRNINKQKNITNKNITTFNGLNIQENIEKHVSLSNQSLKNSSLDTNEAARTDNNIYLTADLNNFIKEITLYNQNETLQTLKMNMGNTSKNNFDKTYLKSDIILDSDTNSSRINEEIFNLRERYKPEKSSNITINAFIRNSSIFNISTFKNQAFINPIPKIMNLSGVKYNSNTNNQYEIKGTTNKSIFNKTLLNDKLQDSLSISSSNTFNTSTLNIIKHLNNLSAANLVTVTEKVQNNSWGIFPNETRKYVNYTSNINTKKKDSVSNPVLTNEEKRRDQNTKITIVDLNKNIKNDVKLKSQFSCNSLHRGRYSDKYDCKKFYICIGRQNPIYGNCPNNTVFSKITKQCTKNLSHCIRNNQFQCTSAGRYIDIFSDQFYYICVKKVEGYIRFKLKCLKGYHLNKTNLHCMLDSLNGSMSNEDSSNTDRNKSALESKSKEDSKMKKEEKKEFKDFQCEKEGKFIYQDDCSKYYQCNKGRKSEFRRKIKKCDSDEVFNGDKRKCVDKESYECKD